MSDPLASPEALADSGLVIHYATEPLREDQFDYAMMRDAKIIAEWIKAQVGLMKSAPGPDSSHV